MLFPVSSIGQNEALSKPHVGKSLSQMHRDILEVMGPFPQRELMGAIHLLSKILVSSGVEIGRRCVVLCST